MDYTLEMVPSRRIGDVNAMVFGHFIEHLRRCIYGGVFEPVSPLADEQGFRTDVLAAMRQIGVPILRWPGGNFASVYDWEDGVGPREQRPVRYNLAWREPEPNTFGTDEFLDYCAALSTESVPCEPYICLNASTGTLRQAARWIEYCNVDADQMPTSHARLRQQLGRSAPRGVTYWGIGNEMYSEYQVGYTTAPAYAALCREYGRTLKRVDRTLKLVAVGADDPDWDLTVLRGAGEYIDYISIHHYSESTSYESAAAGATWVERRLRLLKSVIDVAAASLRRTTPIEIALDEWNINHQMVPSAKKVVPGSFDGFYALKDALFTAGVLHSMYRMCQHVTMANFAQMVNVVGMIHTSPTGLVLSPLYHVFDLYANHTGRVVLDTLLQPEDAEARETFSAELQPAAGVRRPVPDVPYVDVVATLDRDRRSLAVAAINRHRDRTATLRIDLAAFLAREGVEVHELSGVDPDAVNDEEHPDAVVPRTGRMAAWPGSAQLPPCSITILQWQLH
jgi:alpha-N-arabinofuranosidase